VIRPLRRVLSLARGRGSAAEEHPRRDRADAHGGEDPSRRIEEARRRLKAEIPPPED